jgi:predicted acylesterase/phospholipase RssA
MDIYIEQITPTGTLSSFFYKAARKPVDLIINHWAGDHYYSSETPREIFKERFGKRRLSDSPKSLYIAAYNQEDAKFKHFYHRKDDLFANSPDAAGETADGNEFIWDSTMASISSPFAFVPHKTLTGNIYTDQAIIHSPIVSVSDLYRHKEAGTNIKFVYFGVGRYDESFVMQDHKRLGVLGRVLSGGMLSDMDNYSTTMADQALRNLIGADNISVFNPRLTTKEIKALNLEPSRDILDATPENTQKLEQIADSYIEIPRVKARLHNLAIDLCENLYNLGQLSKDELDVVKQRCDCANIADKDKPHHQDQSNSPWQGVKNWLGWAPGP